MSDSLSSLNVLTKSYSDENLISAFRSLARNFRPQSKELTLETSRKEKLEGKKKKELIVEQHVFPMNQIKETKIVISFK
jgi:hypothetical protein